MNRALPLALSLALLLPACQAARKGAEEAVDTTVDFVVDAWPVVLGVAVGSIGGPVGMAVGATVGGAYAVTRQKLYSARDLAEAYRKGEIFGRQQAKDLADAARGAPIASTPAEPHAAPPPWYLSNVALGAYAFLVVVGWLRREKWRRVRTGPDRLRAFENLYLGPLAPLPPAPPAA